jgi:hypothetical protein
MQLAALYFGVVILKGAFLPQKLNPKGNIETRYKLFQAHVRSYQVKSTPRWFVCVQRTALYSLSETNSLSSIGTKMLRSTLIFCSFLFNILSTTHSNLEHDPLFRKRAAQRLENMDRIESWIKITSTSLAKYF